MVKLYKKSAEKLLTVLTNAIKDEIGFLNIKRCLCNSSTKVSSNKELLFGSVTP